MNWKQRSIAAGVVLALAAGLYPPWMNGGYAFLFAPGESVIPVIDLTKLLVEWLLIVVLIAGLFVASKGVTNEKKIDTATVVPKRRLLISALMLMVLALGVSTYAAVRKVNRLEAGIKNVADAIANELPRFVRIGDLPSNYQVPPQPVGQLRPFTVQDLMKERDRRIQQLQNAKAALEKLE
jgi:hypothetical protein